MPSFALSLINPWKASFHRIPRRFRPSTLIMPKRRVSTTKVVRTAVDSILNDEDGPAPSKKARNGDVPIILNAPARTTETRETDTANGSAIAEGLRTPTKQGRGSKVLAKLAQPMSPPASPTRRRSTRATKKVNYGEDVVDGLEELEEDAPQGKKTTTPKNGRTPRKPRKPTNGAVEDEEASDRTASPSPTKAKTSRRRVAKKTTEVDEADEIESDFAESPTKKTPKRTPRKRVTKMTETYKEIEEGSDLDASPKKTPKRTPRKRVTKKPDDDEEFDAALEAPPEDADSEVKPKKTRKKKEKVVLSMEEEIALLDKELEEMDKSWEADVKGELFPDKEPMTTAYNSTDDPLPYTGRLGYACLNTHLRVADPPVFCSRTCRLATLNAADSALEHAQQLGLQNAWDLVKLIEWNEAHNIKFMRISSEMFPFASHPEHQYDLNFAAEPLAKAGELAAKWGHRLTTHPGQFTQLASPRKEVIRAAIADLKYHHELLSLLKLPPQMDKDAVIILHMGGVFGDKPATLQRFRETWTTLPPDVQRRIVLENDDVSYTVHDLLPICQDLNIPLVFDWHHHNIMHDDRIREGTLDVLPLLPTIAETWKRRGIRQKMHYSEPVPGARGRDRRKHSEIVRFLPPGLGDVDLMVEAKGKERAVWGLMRRYGLGGWERKPGPPVVPVVHGIGKVPEEKKVRKRAVEKEVIEDGKKIVKEEVVEEVVEEDSEKGEAAMLDKELDEMEEEDDD